MPACECCGRDGATPLYLLPVRGQVIRHGLRLMPDAALCDGCRRVVEWTLRHVGADSQREDDCGEDDGR